MLRPNDEAKLVKAHQRYAELEVLLADEKVVSDANQMAKLAKEFSSLGNLIELYRSYQKTVSHIHESQEILKSKGDAEFKELAQSELLSLEPRLKELTGQLTDYLDPSKNEPDKNIIVEIRAGTGGLEASLFAADLYRMYTKYADLKAWKLELMSYTDTEAGGVKEVVFSLSGRECSKRLKWESGIHRVQRVPTTEASGRIHTSAVTVAILFEPEEIDLEINPKDLKIDVYRSSGPGGQSVNTTDSAVRITHLPSGTVVVCQDERSQLKNRAKAMRILRARILDHMQQEAFHKESALRKSQVGSGDRSEKIRTYNFPDRRVTDHRIGFTSHQLESILNGDMDELTGALMAAEKDLKEHDRQ
ncbi:MAG: peptide chain release factor 1 [Candidatus Omnitrophica bacterium]|nr:peptide chain release factor 1 [Candidatus Omnitrophota bacterium]MDE2009073.1 peptide chain release factor 1 [Candidatus Omnitrophota bacterium]MDE2214262.1 peptide chain release factor 1 [Candidatus Omnitrophota bacterium]MDE2231299.1 peptide chain release factor 1 [Candidatus Omnitrophota bacterium]